MTARTGLPDDMPLSDELRERSRAEHRSADASVRLTAPLALSSRAVYAPALAAFYHIYAALEDEMAARRRGNPRIAAMYFPEVERRAAFEKDLAFYHGPDWRKAAGPPSPATARYIATMRRAVDEEPLRLVVWCHTMYMAMFGGGAILRVWFQKAFRLRGADGTRAYDFSDTIPDRAAFRSRYHGALNALHLSRGERETLFRQKQAIFALNSTIFEEVRASKEYTARVRRVLAVLALAVLALYLFYARVLRR